MVNEHNYDLMSNLSKYGKQITETLKHNITNFKAVIKVVIKNE